MDIKAQNKRAMCSLATSRLLSLSDEVAKVSNERREGTKINIINIKSEEGK